MLAVHIKAGNKEDVVYDLWIYFLTQPVVSTQHIVELSKVELISGESPLILESKIKSFPFSSNY
jgi:hypothetical protein